MVARGRRAGDGDAAGGLPRSRVPQNRVRRAEAAAVALQVARTTQLQAISLEYPAAVLEAATEHWSRCRRLGTGSFGTVYKGELQDGSEVAIKAIDLDALRRASHRPGAAGFEEEVHTLSKFRHPNLVTLLGWAQQGSFRYLVYEFLAGGDVFRRLHCSRKPDGRPFHWHERLSVCLDAATGLSHMHCSTPKAFHRDIKSANVLLDRHGAAKMADFGLSCILGQADASHVDVEVAAGTPGYKCPIYARTGRFSEASEAYSFGMLALEVVTGLDPSTAEPRPPDGSSGSVRFPIEEAVEPQRHGALDRCLRALDASAAWPLPLAREFAALALRSVDVTFDGATRPRFTELVRALRSCTERFPAQPRVDREGTCRHTVLLVEPAEEPTAELAEEPTAEPVLQQPPPSPPVAPLCLSFQEEDCMPTSKIEAALPEPLKWATIDAKAVGSLAWRLTCIRMEGFPIGGLETIPAESLSFDLPKGVTLLGRHQTPCKFEAWLPLLALRFWISCTQLRLKVSRGGFCVTKMNPTLLISVDGGRPLAKGEERALTPGQELSCMRQDGSGSPLEFLALRVGLSDTSIAALTPRPTESKEGSSSAETTLESTETTASAATLSPSPPSQPSPPSPVPSLMLMPSWPGVRGGRRERGASLDLAASARSLSRRCARSPTSSTSGFQNDRKPRHATAALRPQPSHLRRPSLALDFGPGPRNLSPAITLELDGEGVRSGVVPAQRRLGPVSLGASPLRVGWRHQPELLNAALTNECRALVGFDHFCIAHLAGQFWLFVVAAPPLARERDGKGSVHLESEDVVTLLPGDRIVMAAKLAEGAASQRLCWHFLCVD
mmetsp:Transcript_58342/g.125346  ORF Transcript_58342/g.125346 Transcript_58342/m.125346 type:complete len:838 (+) Transcript_58342:24-2537(+)